jgi:hypothetical protein
MRLTGLWFGGMEVQLFSHDLKRCQLGLNTTVQFEYERNGNFAGDSKRNK